MVDERLNLKYSNLKNILERKFEKNLKEIFRKES